MTSTHVTATAPDRNQVRELPAGYDVEGGPKFVPENLRDLYVSLPIDPDALDAAMCHRRARQDHLEDLEAWERLSASKRDRWGADSSEYRRWYLAETKPADENHPSGERIPKRRSLSGLPNRPPDLDRGTMRSSRKLTEDQIVDATHHLIITLIAAHLTGEARAAKEDRARLVRETCRVCGARSAKCTSTRLLAADELHTNACPKCVQIVPLIAALTEAVGDEGRSRLEHVAAHLDTRATPATSMSPADLEAAMDAWLDGTGPNPVEQPTAPSASGVLSRLRGPVAPAPDAAAQPVARRRRRLLN